MSGHAFLDVIGAGSVSRAPVRQPRRRGAGAAVPVLAPAAAMLAAFALVAAAGLSRRSGLPEDLAPYAYGFFLDRYPLFAFALIYGAFRIIAVAAGPGPAGIARRFVFGLAGLLTLALAGLYPTFGGLILRGGFAVGSGTFLNGMPLGGAYAVGSGVAAAMLGAIVGAFGLAANRPLRPSLRRAGRAGLAFLALWAGAAILGLAHALGFGPWPARAMNGAEAILGAAILVLAALPHTLLSFLDRRHGAR